MPNPASALIGQGVSQAGGSILSPVGNAGSILGNLAVPNRIADFSQMTKLWQLHLMNTQAYILNARATGFNMDHLRPYESHLTEIVETPTDLFADLSPSALIANSHVHEKWALLDKNWPTVDEANIMFNRKLISPRLYHFLLLLNTSGERGLIKAYEELRFVLPPIQDLIRFTVKDNFNPQLVSKFGYNKEFPIEILRFLEMQGLTGQTGVRLPPGSTTTQGPDNRQFANWSDLYWWSHWDLPSPTQGYMMLHRLYWNSPFGPSPDLGGSRNNVFESEDLSLLLKALDYPEYWRNKLEQISYNPLTRVDVRRMFNLRLIDDSAVFHSYRASGYNDENATKLLDFAREEKARYQYGAIGRETKALICKYYKEGIYPRGSAYDKLIQIRFTPEQATGILALCDAEIRSETIKEQIGYLRHAYYHGFIDEQTAKQSMANMGITQSVIDRYASKWFQKKTLVLKHISAQKGVKIFKMGLITEEQLYLLMYHLHYPEPEIRGTIAVAKIEIQQMKAKALAKMLQQQQQANEKAAKAAASLVAKEERELAAAAKAQSALQEKLLNKLLSAYTEKHLVEWKNQGTINYDDVTSILNLKGWDDTAIVGFMEQHWPDEQ